MNQHLPPPGTLVQFTPPGVPRRVYAGLVIDHNESEERPGVHLAIYSHKDEVQVFGHQIVRNEFDVPFIREGQQRPPGRHCVLVQHALAAPARKSGEVIRPQPLVLAPAPDEPPHKSQGRKGVKAASA